MEFISDMLVSPLGLAVGFALIAFGALRLRRLNADKTGEGDRD